MRKIQKLPVIVGVVALHGICYYSVNFVNSLRPSSSFIDFNTIIDAYIPFMGWTWTFYYFGDVYVTVWAAIIVWRLAERKFRHAVYVYIGMIITGAFIQLIIPGRAPWPQRLAPAQHFIHDLISMRPYACLPSMHVALTIMPACLAYSSFRSIWMRIISTLMAILITISTLTLKEHFFLDALTGILLGLVFYGFWRWYLHFLKNPVEAC